MANRMIHYTTNSTVFSIVDCNGEDSIVKYPSTKEFLIVKDKNSDSLYLFCFKVLIFRINF
jgi:hypothetical protein